MAADAAIADSFSFMARHSSGAVRVALSHERAKALRLPEAATQDSGYAGAFPGAPVDYRDTQGHGKTASDQALTARKLVTPETRASDFVQPGHVFPVGAAAGGVLSHDGFAEAAVDLARLAGRRPGAVICDLMTENGQPAETSELKRFAFTHRLALIGLDELMAYRWDTEPIVERVSRRVIATKFGQLMAIGYRRKLSNREILVLMREHDQATMPATIHLHYQCIQGEIFGSSLCGCAGQLEKAVAATATEPVDRKIGVRRGTSSPHPRQGGRPRRHGRPPSGRYTVPLRTGSPAQTAWRKGQTGTKPHKSRVVFELLDFGWKAGCQPHAVGFVLAVQHPNCFTRLGSFPVPLGARGILALIALLADLRGNDLLGTCLDILGGSPLRTIWQPYRADRCDGQPGQHSVWIHAPNHVFKSVATPA